MFASVNTQISQNPTKKVTSTRYFRTNDVDVVMPVHDPKLITTKRASDLNHE